MSNCVTGSENSSQNGEMGAENYSCFLKKLMDRSVKDSDRK